MKKQSKYEAMNEILMFNLWVAIIGTRVALIWDGHQFGTLFTFGDNKLFV